MSEGTRRKQLRTFPDLKAEDFQHPDDIVAMYRTMLTARLLDEAAFR